MQADNLEKCFTTINQFQCPTNDSMTNMKLSFANTLKEINISHHHHFSFSGSVSPKSCVPCAMLVCPLRPPLLTSDWLGCCCCGGIELDWDPDPRSPPAVIVVLVPDDKFDIG